MYRTLNAKILKTGKRSFAQLAWFDYDTHGKNYIKFVNPATWQNLVMSLKSALVVQL
jgi:hypothetical protein